MPINFNLSDGSPIMVDKTETKCSRQCFYYEVERYPMHTGWKLVRIKTSKCNKFKESLSKFNYSKEDKPSIVKNINNYPVYRCEECIKMGAEKNV